MAKAKSVKVMTLYDRAHTIITVSLALVAHALGNTAMSLKKYGWEFKFVNLLDSQFSAVVSAFKPDNRAETEKFLLSQGVAPEDFGQYQLPIGALPVRTCTQQEWLETCIKAFKAIRDERKLQTKWFEHLDDAAWMENALAYLDKGKVGKLDVYIYIENAKPFLETKKREDVNVNF